MTIKAPRESGGIFATMSPSWSDWKYLSALSLCVEEIRLKLRFAGVAEPVTSEGPGEVCLFSRKY